VECASETDCHDATKPICHASVCVECNKDKDCKDPARTHCSAGVCTP
jgi:hypothetical protein